MLNIVIALAEEARPVIQHFRLKRYHHVHPFQVYGSDQIQLIVSGIGKLASATATAFLAGLNTSTKTSAWLNLGIAGGDVAAVGELILAHQIIDAANNQRFYPSICFEFDTPTASIVTLDEAQGQYQAGSVYDMEAAGFFAAAMRFGTAELIHSAKIISDNSEQPVENISRKAVASWMQDNMQQVDRLADILLEIVANLESDNKGEEEYAFLLNKFHFSQSQQTQLRSLLQSWYTLSNSSVMELVRSQEIANARALLRVLETQINATPISF